jgi:hypothetical protein
MAENKSSNNGTMKKKEAKFQIKNGNKQKEGGIF